MATSEASDIWAVFLIKQRKKKCQLYFFSIIGHQNPGSGFNESGSTTLSRTLHIFLNIFIMFRTPWQRSWPPCRLCWWRRQTAINRQHHKLNFFVFRLPLCFLNKACRILCRGRFLIWIRILEVSRSGSISSQMIFFIAFNQNCLNCLQIILTFHK